MDINQRILGDVVILDIRGTIDLYEAPLLRTRLEDLISQKALKVAINGTHIAFIDSSGFGVLVVVIKALRKLGGSIKFYNLNKKVSQVLKITRMDQEVAIYKSETEILESFK